MSGAATAQWELPTSQLELAKKQASLLKCDTQSISSILKCLKQVFCDNSPFLNEKYNSCRLLAEKYS